MNFRVCAMFNYSAAWQEGVCVPIQCDVQVSETPQPDLARVLREQAASGCQVDGAWRRLAATCEAPR